MNLLGKFVLGVAGVGCASAGILAAYSYNNANKVRRTEYSLHNGAFGTPLKILFISDVHYGAAQSKRAFMTMADELCREQFDLVLLGGDIVDESTTLNDANLVFSTLRYIDSKYGIYYIPGNHDGHSEEYNRGALMRIAEMYAIRPLVDSYTVLDCPVRTCVIGREDYYRDDIDVRKSIASIVGSTSCYDYVICVDHAPRCVKGTALEGVDLLLNGHTHAGQLFPIAWYMSYKGEYVYGYDRVEMMDHIISSGASVGAVPFRNSKHCEYVVITVSAE